MENQKQQGWIKTVQVTLDYLKQSALVVYVNNGKYELGQIEHVKGGSVKLQDSQKLHHPRLLYVLVVETVNTTYSLKYTQWKAVVKLQNIDNGALVDFIVKEDLGIAQVVPAKRLPLTDLQTAITDAYERGWADRDMNVDFQEGLLKYKELTC